MLRLYAEKPYKISNGIRYLAPVLPEYGWKWPLKPISRQLGVHTSGPKTSDPREIPQLIGDFLAGIVLVKQGMFRGEKPSNMKGWSIPPPFPSFGMKKRMVRLLFNNNGWYRSIWMGNFRSFMSSPPEISLGLADNLQDCKNLLFKKATLRQEIHKCIPAINFWTPKVNIEDWVFNDGHWVYAP